MEDIQIEVSSFFNDNEKRLTIQMQVIEKKMDEEERQFRTEQSARPFSRYFEDGFSYLVERLHCDLGNEDRVCQAQAHVQMIRERLGKLQGELTDRGFGSTVTSIDIGRISTGLDLLEILMSKGAPSTAVQHEFDLIYDGLEKSISQLKNVIRDIDARLRTPIR